MRISPKAMKKALSDTNVMSWIKNENLELLKSNGFEFVSDMIFVKNEIKEKTDLLDHRSVSWSGEEVDRRYFNCMREIDMYGNRFAKQLLAKHIEMIETRKDFNRDQIRGYRKVMICCWHNIKVTKGIVVCSQPLQD